MTRLPRALRRGTASWALGFLVVLACPLALTAHGDIHDRIAEVTRQIEQAPNEAHLYLKRGELHRIHRDWAAARADYDRALALHPSLDLVDLSKGAMLLEEGRPEEAKAALDRFLTRQPDHPRGRLTRARTLVRLGRRLAAADDFSRAIAHDPSPQPEYYLERAQALAAEGEGHVEEALKGIDEGIGKLGPLVILQRLAIDLELRRARFDAALARLQTLAAQSARQEAWQARRGEILERAGRSREAHEAFAAALAAIEALPAHRRATPATQELEALLRARTGALHANP